MPVDLHLPLPRQISAAGIARKAVVERFADQLSRAQSGDLALVVTELVTNAVGHGRGAISFSLRIRGDRVYGEVVDEGGGFERELRERAPDDLSGRGLLIVDALCSRWGIHEGTTHVWFELARPDTPAKPTEPKLGECRATCGPGRTSPLTVRTPIVEARLPPGPCRGHVPTGTLQRHR